jgi:microcystin-dependent protein
MAQPYIGEIRMFAGNFAPAGWLFCNGALLAISEYEPLFQLIGTTYGGDGQTTFALPDMRGRLPLHEGGLAGNAYQLGELGGVEAVTLTAQQIPNHTHRLSASADAASSLNAAGNVLGTPLTATPLFAAPADTPLSSQAISSFGGSQPHTNMQPFLCVNFIISLFGIFPSQN